MSHFYGTIAVQAKTLATRRGSKSTGLIVHAASWQGAIETLLYEKNGKDFCRISFKPLER